MVLHLAEYLDVPLRERNPLLIAAGYAPTYHATDLAAPGDGVGARGRRPVARRARAVSRRSSSTGAGSSSPRTRPRSCSSKASRRICSSRRSTCCASRCIPKGSRRASSNLPQWVDHVLGNAAAPGRGHGRRRAARRSKASSRATRRRWASTPDARREAPRAIAIPMRLRTDEGELAFITMIATFGTALDITLAELAIETFLPADTATSEALHRRAAGRSGVSERAFSALTDAPVRCAAMRLTWPDTTLPDAVVPGARRAGRAVRARDRGRARRPDAGVQEPAAQPPRHAAHRGRALRRPPLRRVPRAHDHVRRDARGRRGRGAHALAEVRRRPG